MLKAVDRFMPSSLKRASACVFKSGLHRKGGDPHRARYHSSVMDVENLHSGQEFKELQTPIQSSLSRKIFTERASQSIRLRGSIWPRVNLLKMGNISCM